MDSGSEVGSGNDRGGSGDLSGLSSLCGLIWDSLRRAARRSKAELAGTSIARHAGFDLAGGLCAGNGQTFEVINEGGVAITKVVGSLFQDVSLAGAA